MCMPKNVARGSADHCFMTRIEAYVGSVGDHADTIDAIGLFTEVEFQLILSEKFRSRR